MTSNPAPVGSRRPTLRDEARGNKGLRLSMSHPDEYTFSKSSTLGSGTASGSNSIPLADNSTSMSPTSTRSGGNMFSRKSYSRASNRRDSVVEVWSDEEAHTNTLPLRPRKKPKLSVKIVVVGDGGCGKTCLLVSYAKGRFPQEYVPTVFENYVANTSTPHGEKLELALWDTAGQEEYDRLRPLSYPEANIIFICFSVDSPSSLENVLDKWIPEVGHFCPDTPIILIALKADLRKNNRAKAYLEAQGITLITSAQGAKIAEKMGVFYAECSSSQMINVKETFEAALALCLPGHGYEKPIEPILLYTRNHEELEGEMPTGKRHTTATSLSKVYSKSQEWRNKRMAVPEYTRSKSQAKRLVKSDKKRKPSQTNSSETCEMKKDNNKKKKNRSLFVNCTIM